MRNVGRSILGRIIGAVVSVAIIAGVYFIYDRMTEGSKAPVECTASYEEDGVTQNFTALIEGGEEISKMTTTYEILYPDITAYQEKVDQMNVDNEAYKVCPKEGGTDCSKYITFDYSVEGNTLKTVNTIDVKGALKADPAEQLSTFGQTYTSRDYISLEKVKKQFTDEGYVCKEK